MDLINNLLSPLYTALDPGMGIVLLNITRFLVVMTAWLLCGQYRERGYHGESVLTGLLAAWVALGAVTIERNPAQQFTTYPLAFNLLLAAFFITKYLRYLRESNAHDRAQEDAHV